VQVLEVGMKEEGRIVRKKQNIPDRLELEQCRPSRHDANCETVVNEKK
jgi:hypothetical protein